MAGFYDKLKAELDKAKRDSKSALESLNRDLARERDIDKNYADAVKKLRNVTRLYRDVKDFNEKIQETKVTTASDKIALADEYKKIINKNSKYEYTPGVKDVMESSVNYCDHSLRYAGRKMGSKPEEISKEIQDTTLTAEEI